MGKKDKKAARRVGEAVLRSGRPTHCLKAFVAADGKKKFCSQEVGHGGPHE